MMEPLRKIPIVYLHITNNGEELLPKKRRRRHCMRNISLLAPVSVELAHQAKGALREYSLLFVGIFYSPFTALAKNKRARCISSWLAFTRPGRFSGTRTKNPTSFFSVTDTHPTIYVAVVFHVSYLFLFSLFFLLIVVEFF